MKLTLKTKLLLVVIPLVSAIVFFSGYNILEFSNKNRELQYISNLVSMTVINSDLVHELQKERGATAGFLSSKGGSFSDVLRKQRRESNRKIEALKAFIHEYEQKNGASTSLIQLKRILSKLETLKQLRARVDQQNIDVINAITFYTTVNEQLLNTLTLTSDSSPDPVIAQQLIAFYNFLQGKERAGIERAVLSSAFSMNGFTEGLYEKFITLVTEQNTYFGLFETFASDQLVQSYKQAIKQDLVGRYRNAAFSNDLSGDAGDWFKASTARINNLKDVEDTISNSLISLTRDKSDEASSQFYSWLILSLVIILSAVLVALKILLDLNKQVASIVAVIQTASRDKNLKLRASVIAEDELGLISNQLNQMLEVFGETLNHLNDASLELSTTAEEASSVSADNASHLEHQLENTVQVSAAVEQMSLSIFEVAENTQSTVDAVRKVENAASSGETVVNATTKAIHQVSTEVSDVAESIKETLNHILISVDSLVDISTQVATATEEQSCVSDEVSKKLQRINEQTTQTATGGEQIRISAQMQANLAYKLKDMASSFAV